MGLKGVDKVLANLKKTMGMLERAGGTGVYLTAADIMRESVQVTPKKYGTLRGSGYVTLPEKVFEGMQVEIGYGGYASKYAVRRHELPEAKRYTTPGTGAKYLERPFDAAAGSALQNIAAVMRSALALGVAPRPASGWIDNPWRGPDLRPDEEKD